MEKVYKFSVWVFVSALLFYCSPVTAQHLWEGNVSAGPVTHSVDSPAATIDVSAGTVLRIEADPDDLWQVYGNPYPEQLHWTNADGISGMEYSGIPVGNLVGRIGETGSWFEVGTAFSGEMAEDGRLYLACWDDPAMYEDNSDSIPVTITSESAYNPADLDQDRDVDGADLAVYLLDMSGLTLGEVAGNFGYAEVGNNADLAGLTVSHGTLNPAFESGVNDYIIRVGNDVHNLEVTPVIADVQAALEVNGTSSGSGLPFSVNLDVGTNYISIKVTSRDGTVKKEYSIIALRSGTASLSSLVVSGNGLTPEFDSGTRVYSMEVEPSVQEVEITPESNDPSAVIEVNQVPVSSGSAATVLLDQGVNEIEILVASSDGSDVTYLVYVNRLFVSDLTVFVVDQATGPDEFETLEAAVNDLNTRLDASKVGHVRIQASSPMPVQSLTVSGNIMISVAPGASSTISGPTDQPLVVTASGGWQISGLSFTNSPGYTIHAGKGLNVLNSAFSADTVVNISGDAGTAAKGNIAFSKGMKFVQGSFSGVLDINLTGNSDADFTAVGNRALGISFDASGSLTGEAGLYFKSNPIPDLKITAALEGSSSALVSTHGSLRFSKLRFEMQESAWVRLQQVTSASLEAEFYGAKGKVEYENVVTTDANLNIDFNEGEYSGSNNVLNNFHMDFSYTHDLFHFGFTEKGGYAHGTYAVNSEKAPLDAELVFGFEEFNFKKGFNMVVGGKATVKLQNGTVIGLDAMLKLPGNYADITLSELTGKALLKIISPEDNLEFFLSAERSTLEDGMNIEVPSGNINGTVDTVTTVKAGLIITADILSVQGFKSEELKGDAVGSGTGQGSLVLKNLDITDENGQPGLYVNGVTNAVTIQNSTVNADLWSIVCSDIDADVTIENNSDLKGGIMLDGDPDQAGAMISPQYMVSNNTITQISSGGSCISSHAVRNVTVNNNDMEASVAGAHGILVSGGEITVTGGSIQTMGPYLCNAISIGPSAGNANGIVYASNINSISGGIITSEKGYVQLTGNNFSNAVVADYNFGGVGRLLNDPVADNSGVNPDEDVVGSLIDWNDDPHSCPDYPTRCDEWDEEADECGCGENGIDPPADPGV